VLKAGKQFLTHAVPAILKPLRVLWNELIGFTFLAFAVLVGFASWRNLTKPNADGQLIFWSLVGFAFTLLLLWYGISSFRRAKKISRS
jgi:hypothetical protein